MSTKVVVAFTDIFMSKAELEIICKSKIKPLDVVSRWDAGIGAINQFKPTGIIQPLSLGLKFLKPK